MTEHTDDNEIAQADETTLEDVDGHYLPIDDDGNVDLTPRLVDTVDDVEGHAWDLDIDIERKR